MSPLPWGIIVPVFFGGVLLIIVLYVEYRRRKKKRAMERCAAGPACLSAGPPRFPPAETYALVFTRRIAPPEPSHDAFLPLCSVFLPCA